MRAFALVVLLGACGTDQQSQGVDEMPYDPVPLTTPWATTLEGGEFGVAYGIAIDSIGDIVVGGTVDTNVIEHPSGAYPPTTGFITKRVGGDGTARWTVRLELLPSVAMNFTDAGVGSVAIDSADNVIVTGNFRGTVDFGGVQLSSGGASFIAKYTTRGDLVWAKTLETYDPVWAYLKVGAIRGQFYGVGTPDNYGYSASELLSLDGEGELRWSKRFEGKAWPSVVGVAPNGDVLVAGRLEGPASVGGDVLEPTHAHTEYLARYGEDGVHIASRTFGTADEYLDGAAIHESGTIAVVTADTVDGYTVSATNHILDPMLNETAKVTRDTGDVWPGPFIATATGFARLSGASHGPHPPETFEGNYVSIESFDVTGQSLGTTRFGEVVDPSRPGGTYLMGVASSSLVGIAATGAFEGTLDLGSGPMTAVPNALEPSLESSVLIFARPVE